MALTVKSFRRAAQKALRDPDLQGALDGATRRFRTERQHALDRLPDAAGMRDHFKAQRTATLNQLANHLETFESQAQANGAKVHWALDGDEAKSIILDIIRASGSARVVKSKSMATEEIHLNSALEAAGIVPIETDLGEWIIQLAKEPPSHIIGPALHKTRQQVAALFEAVTGEAHSPDDIPGMTAAARKLLRGEFLRAGVGISGGNIAVAESGSIVLVTNEGNGRMVTSVPRVHIALIGIEKVAATWQDAGLWLSLLARSATGQGLSVYTSIISGPRRDDDPDGPEEVHIVLLDNGRSALLGGEFQEILECIRCGACLNSCPVYQQAGGHAYGSPYSGPIGAVISPLLFGESNFAALPQASSLCGACREVCPARIDIPRMLLALRARQKQESKSGAFLDTAEKLMAGAFSSERQLKSRTALLRPFLGALGQDGFVSLPEVLNPGQERSLPILAKQPFRELWEQIE
jgi:L-lactate dehydrogenase complex protein LldF